MSGKHPTWTRARVGRGRVCWVAYDDRAGSAGANVLAQGYAASLPEADAAARSALAALGMYQARRMAAGSNLAARGGPGKAARPPQAPRPPRERPREYLYTRRPGDPEGDFALAAHLILKKTARRVYVTRRSCGPDQVGTDDEPWGENEPGLALDRAKLERDGSVYSSGHQTSDFYSSLDRAAGEAGRHAQAAFRALELRPPCTLEDIKAAYRRKALEAHPDRGGNPADFQAVEAAYRRLLREAQARD